MNLKELKTLAKADAYFSPSTSLELIRCIEDAKNLAEWHILNEVEGNNLSSDFLQTYKNLLSEK